MSRLDELIQEYCPNGVEFKTVGDVATITRGHVMSKDYIKENQGIYPVYSSQTENNGELGYISTYDFDGEYLTWTTDGANAGFVFYRNGKFSITNVCGLINVTTPEMITRFLYFVLSAEAKKYVSSGMGNPKLMSNVMGRIKIPVPPLPVQSEIVRILDNFTELTAELTTELTTELTARKKQYEYYRDNLLTFDTTIKKVRLGDICSVITKGTTPKSYAKTGISFVKTEAFDGARIVPEKLSYVDEETHTTFLRRSILEENDILVTIAGATIGKCAMVPKEILPANTNQALAIIRLAKGNSPKYVMYLLQSDLMKQYMQKNIKGSAQPNLNLKQLNDFIIPLPPLSVQERLVHVLDNFDAICTDLSIGLPAEIEAREKQYEFYRDALLTYAATGEIIAKQASKV